MAQAQAQAQAQGQAQGQAQEQGVRDRITARKDTEYLLPGPGRNPTDPERRRDTWPAH
jgi:hypothetical protein